MRRHLERSAVALFSLFALLALSGCMVERMTGPQVDVTSADRARGSFEVRRDNDPRDPPAVDPGSGPIETASDSLRAGEELR